MFKGMFKVMLDLYLLFQHHTTKEMAKTKHNMFGKDGFSNIHILDDGKTVILSLDTRCERTIDRIVR